MAKPILMDELHLSITAPTGLSDAEYKAFQRGLHSRRFQARLRDAVREVLRHYPSLKKLQFGISR